MKICSKCGETKSSDEFFNSKYSTDGLQNRCKKCDIEYHRQWSRSEKGRKLQRIYHQRYRLKPGNRVKIRASNTVRDMVRRDKIVKPNICSVCKVVLPVREIQAHHPDHTEPKVFIWVCQTCHASLEKVI